MTETCNNIRTVGIFGGTHGNELTGITLARQWMKNPAPVKRSSFHTSVAMGNPRAVEKGYRLIDCDLNRCFTHDILSINTCSRSTEVQCEVIRAQGLNRSYGPKGGDNAYNLIIDIHSTTANQGNTLVIDRSDDPFVLHMARYIQSKWNKACPVVLTEQPKFFKETCSLASVGKHSFSLEVGPIPHGLVREDKYNDTNKLVHQSLDFVQLFNTGTEFGSCELQVYRLHEMVPYHKDEEDQINSVIHADFQGRDWHSLKKGDPIFRTFAGETIKYEGDDGVYPAFINEASFYEKKIAFWTTKRETLTLPRFKVTHVYCAP